VTKKTKLSRKVKNVGVST